MTDRLRRLRALASALLRVFRDQIGLGALGHTERIASREQLKLFVESRTSHVAQTALYGYLRTRAGTRYPELFANPDFAHALEIAKWHIWLACVSDLAVYAGGLIAHRLPTGQECIAGLMHELVAPILTSAAFPAAAADAYRSGAQRVLTRIAHCNWLQVQDDATAFVESPAALIQWAPVIAELKQLDDEIVRNSMRYRWLEVRRDLRMHLDVPALIGTSGTAQVAAGC
jgi:hypothetical protein